MTLEGTIWNVPGYLSVTSTYKNCPSGEDVVFLRSLGGLGGIGQVRGFQVSVSLDSPPSREAPNESR